MTMDSSSTALVVRSASEEKEEEGARRVKKELAEDDVLEILARLPVKSLLRFKCVSKRWYSLIISPNFISMHYTHSHNKNKVSLLLYSCKKNSSRSRNPMTTVSFGFGHVTKQLAFRGHLDQFEIVGCFNGVVCLSLSRRPQIYVLWNPATRQLRVIGGAPMDGPHGNEMEFFRNGGWYGSGFCYDPVTNAFKIAQIRLMGAESGEGRAQVNVFSTATNSWNEKCMHVPYCGLGSKRGATCVNGYIHWHVARHQTNTTMDDRNIYTLSIKVEDMYIMSYNMIDEVFQRIEMPFPPVAVYCHLATYEGSLAIFVHNSSGSGNDGDVWVLNDCGGGNHSWYKLLTCKPASIKVRFAIGFLKKDDVDLVLLCKEPDRDLYLYDPEKGETKKFEKEVYGTQTFIYSESLASLN